MHAERPGYEIQDILYGNAWFEGECESFEGRWVNLAFCRESDTAGAKTSVRAGRINVIATFFVIILASSDSSSDS